MIRASRYVARKSTFVQILLKTFSKKTKDSGGRSLSIRLWIPSRSSQVLWQDLRADVSSREEKGVLKDSVNEKEKVIGFCSAVNLISMNCEGR